MLGAATTRILQIPESILHTQRLYFLHPPVSSKDQSKRLIRLVYNGLRRPLFVNNYSCDGPGRFTTLSASAGMVLYNMGWGIRSTFFSCEGAPLAAIRSI